ncbi:MAG: aminomethyl-transferring glycine dehydrogenase subunit GcvPB [Elusimicrobiales bacterium]|nr:aminomethyl-transferring glycine dehydrogenase subunit GcvPB [Elusimicrobiales bacterium]
MPELLTRTELNPCKAEPQKLSIEKSAAGRRGLRLPASGRPAGEHLPAEQLRKTAPKLPELSEFDVVRHYTNLSRLNFSLDTHFYPLGSCTMKYNPKINEELCALPGFAAAHPAAPDSAAQGTLEAMHNLEKLLCEICGLSAFTLQPSAGAHGEWCGILLARAYHAKRGDAARTEIVVADSSHGTNPASAALGGFNVITVKSGPDGRVDVAELKKHIGPRTALVMLTIPGTVGLFETEICKISAAAHAVGALLYMDGANFNALIGLAKPGDFGVDIMHLNMHKTFSTPHGGGGPGAGAVGVTKALEPFLPAPRVALENGVYRTKSDYPDSIGRLRAFFGNTGVLLRAYCWLRQHSPETLRLVAENAILNANYAMAGLKDLFPAQYGGWCMHECVLSTDPATTGGVRTLDVAKRLLDYGFHAPTVYFPLIVHEALMIEPTETESRESIDLFVAAMRAIHAEALENPELLKKAPHTRPVKRLDEVGAARQPDIRW